jgi:hypothetical protein
MSRRESKTSQNNIVGRWKNGTVAWESEVLSVPRSSSPERPKTSDGLWDDAVKAEPPKLQVMIPASSYKMFQSIPYLSNSAIDMPTYAILSGNNDVSPPSVSTSGVESFQVSALDLQSGSFDANLQRTFSINAGKFHDQTQTKEKTLQVPNNHEVTSSSSSTSGSISGDDEYISETSSHRSSLTSIESLPGLSHDHENEKRDIPEPLQSPKQETPDPFIDRTVPRSPGLSDLIHLVRTPSTTVRTHRRNRSLSSGPVTTLRTLPEANEDQPEPSPTLSEAESELERSLYHLSTAPSRQCSISCQPSMARKPLVPPRSEKRLSIHRDARSVVSEPVPIPVPIPAEPESPKATFLVRSSSVRSTLSLILEEDDDRQISSEAAESVIFHILQNTNTLDDLFNMALINRGFYRVFKRHELELMQTVLRAQSPAAWEFRMTSMPCVDESDDDMNTVSTSEFNTTAFYDNFLRDALIVAGIKHLILERCQSILRPDTVHALRAPHVPHAASRVDDALYRIWTFCLLFGSDLGREDDIATQMDWLRGGVEAHQVSAESSFSSSGSLFMSSTLLICSEHFGRGNEAGLTAEQLYDMTELWNCLRTISQGIIGRTERARQFGVFDCTDVRGGDIDGEEAMLGKSLVHPPSLTKSLTPPTEEWHNYLLTLGLPTILDISSPTNSLLAFALARRHHWTSWVPPLPGSSRSQFLRECVSRLYEERIFEAFSPVASASASLRDLRRKRGSSLALELKKRKANLAQDAPYVHTEVMMSRANTIVERLSGGGSAAAQQMEQHQALPSDFSQHPAFRDAAHAQLGTEEVPSLPPSTPNQYTPPMQSPGLRRSSYAHIMPPLSPPPAGITVLALPPPPPPPPAPAAASVLVSQQHPFQIALQASDASMHSPEKAIFRIVEMGFTADEAKGALKITDLGDGLRVDRAVEYLLRQQSA